MKIRDFMLEMIVGVLPATFLAPLAIFGSMFSVIGATEGWKDMFHPFGILGIFGLAGMIGLWLVVPLNAFKKDYKPNKIQLVLLSLGILSVLPILYVGIFISVPDEPKDFYLIICLVGPLIIASKYIYCVFKK